MGKKVYLTFDTSLTDICEVNSSFDKGVLRICYAGENRNKSYIAKEDLERCVKTLPYVPVVGNYIREDNDFGGHDVEVITTSDGELTMVNKTQPLGVVPADANIYFDTITDTYGEEKEYLFTDVLLWKRQEAYKKIKEDGVISHSMEITVKSGEVIDDIYHIYDFEFTALCLLGSKNEPCFEDSALEVFTTSDFKAQFELMMKDFKESFNLATTSKEEEKYSQDDTLTKGGEEDLKDEGNEVFTEEVAEVETHEEFAEEAEVVQDVPEEEFEAEEPAEDPAEEPTEEPTDEPEEKPEEEAEEEVSEEQPEDFALIGDISRALHEMLCEEMITDEEGYKYPRYFFVDFDSDAGMVYFEDAEEQWRLFGCAYHMDGDNVVIDFETKKRMKYSIVEFDNGSEDTVGPVFESICNEMDARANAKYHDQISAYEEELTELRDFKAKCDMAEAINEHNEVIAEFEDLANIAEFEELCENMLDIDVDTLREKCYAIRGKNVTNPTSAKFSLKSGMPTFPVESNGIRTEEIEDAPYGGVVEKYKHIN